MKRLFVIAILAIIVIGLIFPNQYIYANSLEDNFIRIRLTSPIKSNKIVNLYSESGFSILEKDNSTENVTFIDVENLKVTIGEDEEILISDVYDNPLFSYYQEEDLVITSNDKYDRKIKIEDKTYRDYIEFRIVSTGLIAINYADINNYLYGVVPREMPASFEMEALKAQAIAARTYTLKNINKHNSEGYDLCDTTHCQVYGGMDGEQEKTNRAVDETYGMIITYNGEIIDALYHSNSGGVTEDSLEAWGNNHPYLISVDDEFSNDAPNSNWSINLTADEINKRLKKSGINIGNVLDMEVLQTSSNGRVTQLKVLGTLGERILNKGEIRGILGDTELKSTWFTIKKQGSSGEIITHTYVIDGNSTKPQTIKLDGAHIIDGNNKRSSSRGLTSRFVGRDGVVEEADKSTSQANSNFLIEGKGYGHGVGMSQWGAQRMAELGHSYDEILKHYYNGVEIIIKD
ncbi:SpoIID/LytB domain-containing protein [Clostridium sp. Cult1]|uniref:SpoIID/LytB domain-containing protein n=1 Tax=Clostridium sp. Cult1 TaxID=2079002 RepID=UPI001F38E9F8|nr:SpoIID/LytB domain-containing protein [Clostridium sp. Cult1]MCF6462748.1 hypothetical protein [Clostridium sp. Cult1]